MDSRSFLIFALVVLAVFHTGEAIKCYECDSITDTSCVSKKLESKHEKNCVSNYLCAACTIHMEDGKDYFSRQCVYGIYNLQTQAESSKIKSIDCGACNKDLCNGASTNVLTLGWLGLLWVIRSMFAGAY